MFRRTRPQKAPPSALKGFRLFIKQVQIRVTLQIKAAQKTHSLLQKSTACKEKSWKLLEFSPSSFGSHSANPAKMVRLRQMRPLLVHENPGKQEDALRVSFPPHVTLYPFVVRLEPYAFPKPHRPFP